MPGKHNVVADALSCWPDLAAADVEQDVTQSAVVVMDMQGGDDLRMKLQCAQ